MHQRCQCHLLPPQPTGPPWDHLSACPAGRPAACCWAGRGGSREPAPRSAPAASAPLPGPARPYSAESQPGQEQGRAGRLAQGPERQREAPPGATRAQQDASRTKAGLEEAAVDPVRSLPARQHLENPAKTRQCRRCCRDSCYRSSRSSSSSSRSWEGQGHGHTYGRWQGDGERTMARRRWPPLRPGLLRNPPAAPGTRLAPPAPLQAPRETRH